jgi:hypothetical protein
VNLIGTHIGSYVVEGELGAGCAGPRRPAGHAAARPQLFVSWLEHPYPDPSLAAVVFLSLHRVERGGAVRPGALTASRRLMTPRFGVLSRPSWPTPPSHS